MNRRMRILLYWLQGTRNQVTLGELLAFLSRPTIGPRARRVIRKVEESGNDLVVWLNGIERPMFWPKEFPLSSLHQVVAESFYPYDWHYYEVDATRVRNGDVVVDCGAAEGLFTLLTADTAKAVHAVEPLPRFVETLHRTFDGVSNVKIVPCAIDERPGKARLSSSGIASSIGKANEGTEVEVTTLDELFAESDDDVSYIKADLEGYDVAMLRGATDLISRNHPRIAITTYHRAEHARQIEDLLRRISPKYKIRCKGIFHETGSPVMLHAWAD